MLNALLILTGPTGTGKTEVSLHLARKIRTEIISADSRQIYKGMDIGTDKVSEKIRAEIPHHLIDVVSAEEVFSAFDFKEQAEAHIKRLQKEDKLPIVCGGTGLYIKALTSGIFPGPGRDDKLREKLRLRVKENGLTSLYDELRRVDWVSARRIHPNDEVRIVRALEVFYKTGIPISEHQKDKTFSPEWKKLIIGLCWRERTNLYRVTEERVDSMVQRGLVDEVKGLIEAGYTENLFSMQALGYKQILDYFQGKITLKEAVVLIKRDTRRFAKRQMTWFKKEKDIIWLERENYASFDELSEKIIDIVGETFPAVKV